MIWLIAMHQAGAEVSDDRLLILNMDRIEYKRFSRSEISTGKI
jgi:hypothetical protein